MIHIVIGTKAQFIKMAPLMWRLRERNVEYNLIDLGQHSLITRNLRDEFKLKEPDIYLSRGKNISSLLNGIFWTNGLLLKGMDTHWVKTKIFRNNKGVCLIHGDTISTLIAVYLARRAGVKVAHIEAGLRSYNPCEPFPEEIVRIIAMRLSDILFAPSPWAFNNLKKMGLGKKSFLASGNTSLESTIYSLNKKIDINMDSENYVLVTVHRMETILFKKRLVCVINTIEKISRKFGIIFVQHPSTTNQLKKFGLQERLEKIKNIRLSKIISHAHFIHLLNRSEFVVTDGGSVQEETFYLNKPCLLLRNRTERMEGLGENVILSGFKERKIMSFLDNYTVLRRKSCLNTEAKPSEEILKRVFLLPRN